MNKGTGNPILKSVEPLANNEPSTYNENGSWLKTAEIHTFLREPTPSRCFMRLYANRKRRLERILVKMIDKGSTKLKPAIAVP